MALLVGSVGVARLATRTQALHSGATSSRTPQPPGPGTTPGSTPGTLRGNAAAWATGSAASPRPDPAGGRGTRPSTAAPIPPAKHRPVTPAPAAEAPSIGIAAGGTLQFDPPAAQERYLTAAHDLGATWLRFDFTWNDIQRSDATHYDWARYDDLVGRAQRHGFKVLGMIGYAPFWARDPSCVASGMCRPRNPSEYGRFAGEVARRYAPRGVHSFEVWNEPNLAAFFAPVADPDYYSRMLAAAYTAIHLADPAARVVSGGTAPAATNGRDVSPLDFVSRMYAAGAGDRFDTLGHHPYCYAGSFDCPRIDAAWSAWSQMSSTPVSLRGLLAAHGDSDRQIWATEFGAPTSGGAGTVSEDQQARILAGGADRFARYPWAGPLFIYSLLDRGTNVSNREDWFGVLRRDGSRKPSYARLQQLLQG